MRNAILYIVLNIFSFLKKCMNIFSIVHIHEFQIHGKILFVDRGTCKYKLIYSNVLTQVTRSDRNKGKKQIGNL